MKLGVTYQPLWVGWRFHHGRWEAGCSGDSRGAVTRKLLDYYGDKAEVLVLESGKIPTEPPVRVETQEPPSYGRSTP